MADIHVYPDGKLIIDEHVYQCALGRSGVIDGFLKKEGDGFTPSGTFKVSEVYYRPDREARPDTSLKVKQITERCGWVDNPGLPAVYNRYVELPHNGCIDERLWRDDHVYDILVPIGFNDGQDGNVIVPGKGSAIFLHVVKENYEPTAGCVALSLDDLREVIEKMTPKSQVIIHAHA